MPKKSDKDRQAQLKRIQALSQTIALEGNLVSRATLSGRLGQQYGTDAGTYSRDIYEALGYPIELKYQDFATRYIRQDIARAVIDKPVDGSWQGGCLIQESTDEDTLLEKSWKSLIQREELDVFGKLNRLDKLVGIGSYGVLLFGLGDVSQKDQFALPITEGKSSQLIYLRPLGEDSAKINQWETDTSNPRYGQPLYYDITLAQPGSDSTTNLRVHFSRVLHIPGEILEGTVKGSSRLLPIYNRLFDLEKLVGGSAEMFWRGARPGYKAKVDPEYTLTTDDEDDFKDQLDEYEHNLRRFLVARGMDINSLDTQVADPSNHVDIQIQMISAQTGIPKRILTGSERGELASTQDLTSWYSLLQARRENYLPGSILRPFIHKCQDIGVLAPIKSEEEGYSFVWTPLFEKSDKDKAEVGKIRATALNQYAAQPMAEAIVPPEAFYKYFLGFEQDQIDMITKLQEAAIDEEGKSIKAAEEEEKAAAKAEAEAKAKAKAKAVKE